MLASPPIAVERLVKIYKTIPAVDGISFTLAPGSITGLLGGNGAGKTTTIAMIMGLVTPTSGRVTVLGAEMPRQRYRVLQRMIFESPYVEMPMRLTIRQNLTVFGMLYGVPDVAERIEQLGEALELTDLLDRPTGRLSAGQKTRVSLAKSLINAPDLLLLDEPTVSLDPDTADWVRARLERYRRDRPRYAVMSRFFSRYSSRFISPRAYRSSRMSSPGGRRSIPWPIIPGPIMPGPIG
jgi:ABC-2 type transport system ATP-binding protein